MAQALAPPSAPPGPPAGTPHAGAGTRTYVVIGGFLLLLTIMEVAVFYIEQLSPVLVPVLIFLALAKFVLVAMFYMHLRFDHPWFTYLFVGPLVIAAGKGLHHLEIVDTSLAPFAASLVRGHPAVRPLHAHGGNPIARYAADLRTGAPPPRRVRTLLGMWCVRAQMRARFRDLRSRR